MRNIILTGLSGSGKSTLAAAVAPLLGLRHVDLDAEIERETGMPITDIFRQYGEEWFRELETKALREAAHAKNAIVATGGGAVLREENIKVMRESGLVVFLDRPVDRIAGDLEVAGRPLLQDGADRLRAMAAERRPHYERSCHAVFPNTGPLAEAVPALAALIRGETLADGYSGYAVIGDPIGHSLSPAIHRTVFDTLGVPDPYHAMLVPRGGLARFMDAARSTGLKGFNITAPHKKDILPLLDHVHEDAARCGAVNTVVRRDGAYWGYNTDMEGLHIAVQTAGSGYRGKRVLVLGTGGAAAGAAIKAALEGAAAVAVHGRRPEAVSQVLALLSGTPAALSAGDLGDRSLAESAAVSDLVLNCLPLGMTGTAEDGRSFGWLESLPSGALVVDLVYSPPRPPRLVAAELLGRPVQNGLPMLIFQALLSDRLYLGQTLDLHSLYRAVEQKLTQQEKENTGP